MSNFLSDLSASTVGKRSKPRVDGVTSSVHSSRASAVRLAANGETAENVTNQKKQQDEPKCEMLETTQLVLEDLWQESRLFHLQYQETIPKFRPEDVTEGATLGTGEYGIVYEITALKCGYKPSSKRLIGEDFLDEDADRTYEIEDDAEEVPIEIKRPSIIREMPPSASRGSLRAVAFADTEGDNQQSKEQKQEPQKKPPRAESFAGDNTAATPNLPDRIKMQARTPSPMIPPKSIVILPPAHGNIPVIDTPPANSLQASQRKHRRGDSRSSFSGPIPGDLEKNSPAASITAPPERTVDIIPPPPSSSGNNSDNVSDFDDLTDDDSDDGNKSGTVYDLQYRMSRNINRDGRPRYAVKRLKDNLSEKVRMDAVVDLACEAEFMKRISHSNIVRLRAVVGEPGTLEYALVLDRLTQTLNEKLVTWKTHVKQCRGKWGIFGRDNEKLDRMLTERLLVSFDIARALQHLHKRKILYRDLKPENAGFNVRGDIKLFDFGLAKELKERDLKRPPDGYEATGLTGSRRYMAPEVVRCDYYGFKADVFSFGILFWEIIALKTPFPDYDASKHFDNVVRKHKRPARLPELPSQVHSMMEDAWSPKPKKRPTFRQINQILLAAITDRVGMSADVVSDRSAFLIDRSIRSMYGDDRFGNS